MKKYSIEIAYTSNKDKAGIMTVVDLKGKEVFSCDVILPSRFHHESSLHMEQLEEKSYLPEQMPRQAFRETDREKAARELLGESFFKAGNILFAGYSKMDKTIPLEGIDEVFTLSKENIVKLKNLLKLHDATLEVNGKKKWLMWGQKKCKRTYSVPIYDIIAYGDKLDRQYQSERIQAEDELKREKLRSSAPSQPRNQGVPPSLEKVSESMGARPNLGKPPVAPSYKSAQASPSSSRLHRRHADDDIFDDLYIMGFPDTAIMFRPDSALAWQLFFLNRINEDTLRQQDIGRINQIPGFENVRGCEVHPSHPDGGHNNDEYKGAQYQMESYKVDLYEDEAKTKLLGTVEYEPEKGLKISSHSVETVVLPSEDGKYTAVTQGINGSKAYMEAAIDEKGGLQGSWHIEPRNAMPVDSSFSLSLQEGLVSNESNKDWNSPSLTRTEDYSASSENTFRWNHMSVPEEEPSYQFKPQEDYKIPPPPPPPPPEDNNSYQYQASDPYSRSFGP